MNAELARRLSGLLREVSELEKASANLTALLKPAIGETEPPARGVPWLPPVDDPTRPVESALGRLSTRVERVNSHLRNAASLMMQTPTP